MNNSHQSNVQLFSRRSNQSFLVGHMLEEHIEEE
jgi:hypothetical protein